MNVLCICSTSFNEARLRVGNRRFETPLPALVNAFEDADICRNRPRLSLKTYQSSRHRHENQLQLNAPNQLRPKQITAI